MAESTKEQNSEMDVLSVQKRDGSVQPFDISKVVSSFNKVYRNGLKREVPGELLDQLISLINKKYINKKRKKESVPVEDIQDTIRDFLMKKDQEAAQAFVIYREQRSNFREANTKLYKNMQSKLFAKNVVNQNANLDEHSFSGRVGELASEACRDFALKNSMSKMAKKNHEGNYIYQHDLDRFTVGMHNCLSEPLDDVLGNGIKTRQTDIRPCASLNTAFQMTAVNFQLQSLCQFGGISATHIDWTMVPYFRISFFKHYINGLKYVEGWSDKKIKKFCSRLGVDYKSEQDNNLSNDTVWDKIKRLF